MKGIELPINTLVLFAIAIVVLIFLVYIVTGGVNPPVQNVMAQGALQECCFSLVANDCNSVQCKIPDSLGGGTDEIFGFAQKKLGWDSSTVKNFCKCPKK